MDEIVRKGTTVGVPAKREAVIETLNEAYARDVIELEEFESRIDQAEQARSIEDLDQLTADLPREILKPAQQPQGGRYSGQSHSFSTVLGTKKLSGHWLETRNSHIKVILSSITIDLRTLQLPPGITTINLNSILSEVIVIVPPGLRLENRCRDILSSTTSDDLLNRIKSVTDSLIHITGKQVLSALHFKVK